MMEKLEKESTISTNTHKHDERLRMKKKTFQLLFSCFIGIVIYFYFRLVNIIFISNQGDDLLGIKEKPPLDRYIQGWNITGNVNWLLDFAIVGFPKTGTSTLMVYLRNQTKSVFIFADERCEIAWNQHVPLLQDLHKNYKPYRKMGIKCPSNLEVDLARENYNKFFRKTKFIVGLRHPIAWFQSFYNFRVTNGFEMLPAQRLIGRCKRGFQGVCTHRANFSRHLEKIDPNRNIFLYEVSQLRDHDASRSKIFLDDFGDFLGLKLDQPMIHVRPGQSPESDKEAEKLQRLKINICEDHYSNLRKILLEQASRSSKWIREVFMANPNVHVSSPKRFSDILSTWNYDPCTSNEKIE